MCLVQRVREKNAECGFFVMQFGTGKWQRRLILML
jgi:hypothetical protein